MWVCKEGRERERERENVCVCVYLCACMCGRVCVRALCFAVDVCIMLQAHTKVVKHALYKMLALKLRGGVAASTNLIRGLL